MILTQLCGRLKAIVLAVLAIFRRALCCFSRKRRNSYSDDTEVLQMVSVVGQQSSSRKAGENDRDWNSWDETPRTVDEHIEQYRQKLVQTAAAAKDKEKEAPADDFFQDMTPKIMTQTKVLLRTGSSEQPPSFARLVAPTAALVPSVGPDLEDWTDDNQQPSSASAAAGWEELDDEHTKNMIREKRREQRHHLHQVQQQQKSSRNTSSQAFAQRKN